MKTSKTQKSSKLIISDIGGDIVKENDTYTVKDNTELNNLVVSSTLLHPGKETTGHIHEGQEEVYIFVRGSGIMKIDETMHVVKEGDVRLIYDGAFHKVINDNNEELYFVCVFDGGRNH